MKKFIVVLILMLSFLLCLTACNDKSTDSSKSRTNPSSVSDSSSSVYETLNELIYKSYDKILLNITTTTEDLVLNAGYEISGSEIVYEVEQFNMITLDGELPEDYKKTLRGVATVENGEIIEIDGQAVELPNYNELIGKFYFSEDNLINEEQQDGYYYAQVVSSEEFFSNYISVENLFVEVSYSNNRIQSIKLTYNTSSSTVESNYVFE